ncbi:MAG: hypothetical protein HY908_07935 [Myxococcales bacterium]|nr:hypothetical protein [Myxococcales bacterium]
MRRRLGTGPTHARFGTALGAVLLAGALPGCAMLGLSSGPSVADADGAFATKDEKALADMCQHADKRDARERACRNFFLLQANRLEEMYARGEGTQIKAICDESVKLDLDPATGKQFNYSLPWDAIKDALPGKLAPMSKQSNYQMAHAYTLACVIHYYDKKQAEAEAGTAEKVDPARVKSIAIPEEDVCPGRTEPVRIAITLDDGKTLETWTKPGERKGHVDYTQFALESDRGTFGESGLEVSADLSKLMDGVTVKAALAGRSEIKADKKLKLDFGCMKPIALFGASGAEGAQGSQGQGFIAGTSTGTLAAGGEGGTGSRGGTGGPGPNVLVDVGVVDGGPSGTLLVAHARTDAAPDGWWWAQPLAEGGKLEITIGGGSGGTGGYGGIGGQGEGSTSTSQKSGRGGTGGTGGQGGTGGDSGTLTVRYDKGHPELADRLVLKALGGAAGNGGGGGQGGPAGSGPMSDVSGNNGSSGPPGSPGKAGTTKATPVAGAELFKGKGLRLK